MTPHPPQRPARTKPNTCRRGKRTANLAQAQPTAWGRIVAAVPPGAFLVTVSMIERRAARRPGLSAGEGGSVGEPSAPGRPSPLPAAGDEARDGGDEALLAAARRAAA